MLKSLILDSTNHPILYNNELILEGEHYTGETYGGGVVFYTWSGGTHGYIISDIINSVPLYVIWGCIGVSVTTSYDIGQGRNNTDLIIASCSSPTAAEVAFNYSGGGYTDWFLPSTKEAELTRPFITNDLCWASSEYNHDPTRAVLYRSTEGGLATKDRSFNVRAIREF